MSVNEQVEALELSAADPLAELVAPRIIASTLTLPLLTVVGTWASAVSAVLTATYAIVVFSILAQGLTVGRLIRRVAADSAGDPATGASPTP